MKCTVEKLDWTTAYTYKIGNGKNVDLTLPLETIKTLCKKHDINPELGASEASFSAFRDWLYRHRRTKEMFYGESGFDIRSLVNLFDDDLKGAAKIN